METLFRVLPFGQSLQIDLSGAASLAQIQSQPVTDPVAVFLIILAIMLVAPLLFERLQLPGIVGLILAGVVVGPNGWGLLERDSTIVLLGTVGLLFLMFMAGLETSLNDLKYNASKAITFGLATFAIPMVIGTVAMLFLDYSFLAAILVASCFASHTLLALPILSKLGIMRTQAVTTTLGGTLITNVLALLVLAVVIKAQGGTLTLGFWLFLIPALVLYTWATLWGVPKVGRWFFRRFGQDESAEFIFVLATLFVISYLANLIEIEPIIGAFLAGIAITQLIPQLSPLMNRIQFIGNTLFVPFFLISVGMLIDPLILIEQPESLLIATVIVIVEIISKYIAAWGCGKLFGFEFPSIMVMFGLSSAQAASTLAAITVAFDVELVDQLTVNGIVAMILVTCIASPWITERWGKKIKGTASSEAIQPERTQHLAKRVLVPVANPATEDNLLQLALILAKTADGVLLPLHVISDRGGEITQQDRMLQTRLLSEAEMKAHSAVTKVESVGRIDDAIDRAIVRTAVERNATLIICGWKGYSTTREHFFGSVIDKVAQNTPIPMIIARFSQPIENTRRVLLAVAEREDSDAVIKQVVVIAHNLATEMKAAIQLVMVGSQKKARSLANLGLNSETPVLRMRGNFVRNVSQVLQPDDLLILTSYTQANSLFSLPIQFGEPEAIARLNPRVSIAIAHFPWHIYVTHS